MTRSATIKREKQLAQDLRKTNWWQAKIAKARCYYCDTAISPSEATMDHIVPLASGGRSTKSNIVVCCKPCNTRKRDLSAVEFMFGLG